MSQFRGPILAAGIKKKIEKRKDNHGKTATLPKRIPEIVHSNNGVHKNI